MVVTEWGRQALAYRRECRRLRALGWEPISENGAPLWELHRGPRMGHRIEEARVGIDGLTVWVRITPSPS